MAARATAGWTILSVIAGAASGWSVGWGCFQLGLLSDSNSHETQLTFMLFGALSGFSTSRWGWFTFAQMMNDDWDGIRERSCEKPETEE